MDALAGADGKMMLAVRTDFQVLVQLLVENHRAALRALRPQALGNVALAGFTAGELGLFDEGCGIGRGRWRDRRLRRFQPQRLLREGSRCHGQKG